MKQVNALMQRYDTGFSLVELLVYMVILGILMGLVVSSFNGTMQRSAQQTSITQTNTATNIGLELLRSDVANAGFGLPWQWSSSSGITYTENDFLGNASEIPSAFSSEDDSTNSLNESDYLVIRGTNVARDAGSQKCGYVGRDSSHTVKIYSTCADSFTAGDRVMVVLPVNSAGEYRELVTEGATYSTYVTDTGLADESLVPEATSNDPDGEKYLVYGLDEANDPKRPFNRTDYFISNTTVPSRCAPNTGVLVKATENQSDDSFTSTPIVDCVADFQVVYYCDTDGDGGWDTRLAASGLQSLTAQEIRSEVKLIGIYVLTHEGGADRNFTYTTNPMNVGEVDATGTTLKAGRTFDLSAKIGDTWPRYRWKVESLTITPENLNE